MVLKIQRGEIVSGRPQFEEIGKGKPSSSAKPLMSENPLLRKLAPSAKHSKVIQALKWLASQFLKPFKITYPDVRKERLSRLIRPKTSSPFTFGNVVDQYQKYLKSEKQCHPSLKKCFDHLEKDQIAISKIANLKDTAKGKKLQAELDGKMLADFNKMKEGESKIFILQGFPSEDGSMTVELLCVLTKQAHDHYGLHFIGSDRAIGQLNGAHIPLAGKEKRVKELYFENIPAKGVETNVGNLMHDIVESISKGDISTDRWQKLISPKLNSYQKKADTLDDLTSLSTHPLKMFWSTVHAVSTHSVNKGTAATAFSLKEEKRMKLRSEMLSLFETFQKNRYGLKAGSETYLQIKQALELVSANTLQAYEKGYIDSKDLDEVCKELNAIEKELVAVKNKKPSANISKIALKKPLLEGLTKEVFQDRTKVSVKTESLKLGHRSDGVKPSSKLPEAKTGPISLESYSQIRTKQEFLNKLQELNQSWHSSKNKAARDELFRFFSEVPLNTFGYTTTSSFEKKFHALNSFWWDLSPSELDVVTIICGNFAAELRESAEFRQNIHQYEYEALFKMSALTLFAETRLKNNYNYFLRSFLSSKFDHYSDPYMFVDIRDYEVAHNFRQPSTSSEQFDQELKNTFEGIKDYFKESDDKFHHYDHKGILKTYPNTSQVHKTLETLGGSFNVSNLLYVPSKHSNWMRPISNPFLISLYRQAGSRVFYDFEGERADRKEAVGDRYGRMTPEAFRTDPEGIFRYFLDDMNEAMKALEKENERYSFKGIQPFIAEEELLKPVALTFSKEEQTRLLMLLRLEKPQVELIAFMKENQHLMLNPEVRNFCNALFFNQSIVRFLKREDLNRDFIQSLPKQIEEECQLLEKNLQEVLKKDPIEDPKLAREQLDLLLYYIEMQVQLKNLYVSHKVDSSQFAEMQPQIENLSNLCFQRPEFFSSATYAARVQLRMLIKDNKISQENLPKFLLNYFILKGGYNDPANVDPFFDQELNRHWKSIEKALETNPTLASGENLQAVLDHFCYMKDLPLDGSSWKHQGNGRYTNAKYDLNLKTMKVSVLGEEAAIQYLPQTIANQPLFGQTFHDLKNQSVRVNTTSVNGSQIYSFLDSSQKPCQIEKTADQVFMYKELDIEGKKWFQSLPLDRLKPSPKLLEALKKLSSKDKGKKITFKGFLEIMSALFKVIKSETKYPLPFLFDNGLFIDPKNQKTAYSIDEKGKTTFKFGLSHTKNGLTIDYVIDLRGKKPSEPMQVNHGAKVNHKGVEALSALENKENILLWSSKGRLKKAELPRLGLSFSVSDGRLKCKNPAYKGYYLKLDASIEEKKGFPKAIVLEHPDPTKPKKLIVPNADALIPKEEMMGPTAFGMGKIFLFIKQIVQLIKILRGRLPKLTTRQSFGIDPKLQKVAYTSFDLRPYTGEICQKEKDFASDLMQLVKQAVKMNQPVLALEYMRKIPLKNLDQKTLNLLTSFLQKVQVDKEGVEAAVKFKLCFDLKTALKKDSRLNENLRNRLQEIILDQGKAMLVMGRKVPYPLQMSEQERLEFAHIAKNKDLAYYKKHVQPYFVKKGEVYDFTAPSVEHEDELLKNFKAWKKAKPKVDIDHRIQNLEKKVDVLKPLNAADLKTEIPKLKPGEEVPLLFTDDKVKNLFAAKDKKLPELKLSAKCSQGTACEKEALDEFQADIDQFKDQESKKPSYTVRVTPRRLKRFLNKDLIGKKNHYEKELGKIQAKIEAEISHAKGAEEQISIYCKKQVTASFDELRIALTQGRLEELQKNKRLPSNLDLDVLRSDLGTYFDCLSRKNASEAAIRLIEEMLETGDPKNVEQWESLSTALHRLLTVKRFYSAKDDPRLVAFEAQQFINFKPLEGGLDQLDLLEALLKNPHAIIQAPTGAGKTSVLSVMRSLLKANGKNLVIQKVLPALYQQTYDQMKEVLGGLYGTAIYPLQFSLSMPLVTRELVKETDASGKTKEVSKPVSVFKGMYHQMLETIDNRGCILTDYKSLPLLEEKFWKIGQEMHEKSLAGEAIDSLTEQHFTYLKKILNLLAAKADENMDEFDQPNRPIHKVQLELGLGAEPFPPGMIDLTMEISDLLFADKELKLAENIQGDLSEATRRSCIKKAAVKMAEKMEPHDAALRKNLLAYFLGENEDVLAQIEDKPETYKDAVTLCKDQFSVYMPLTLRGKSPSRYARSGDGKRTLPCYNGEKHEAKFGTMLEQVNYTIQDYRQNGITDYDIKEWFYELNGKYLSAKEDAKKPFQKQLEGIFPGQTFAKLETLLRNAEGTKKLVTEINKNPDKVKFFLKLQLSRLKTSGIVIPMDPQNIVDMSRAVSGTSATMGAPESLHRQFEVDHKMNGQIRANMALRLCRRAADPDSVLKYDPSAPEKMLKEAQNKKPISVLIDGAGAFKKTPEQSAKTLLETNSNLQQVGYQDEEKIKFVGTATGDTKKSGYFFGQAFTRGSDRKFGYDVTAVLTVSEKDGIREYFQKEGRLRQDTQRYLLAISQYQEGTNNVYDEISKAVSNDALVDAQDIFRKSKQEFMAIIRKEARKKLLATDNVQDFIKEFSNDKIRKLFISPKPPSYMEAGSYHKSHKHIQKEDQSPFTVLTAYKEEMKGLAQELNLPDAVSAISKIEFSEHLLAKMPKQVAPINPLGEELEMEHEVEVEQEQEQEMEQQLEMQMEMETENIREGVKAQVGIYPLRTRTKAEYNLANISNMPFAAEIDFSDSFLPLSRKGTASIHQRSMFDAHMYRVGIISIQPNMEAIWNWQQGTVTYQLSNPAIKKIIIEDPLEDSSRFGRRYMNEDCFFFDMRTNKVVSVNTSRNFDINEILSIPRMKSLFAQIKFFDGQTSGYSNEELSALELWLKYEEPEKMRDHLLNTILRYRYTDKLAFAGSQLEELFDKLLADESS